MNYVKQFMEDHGLEFGQRFRVVELSRDTYRLSEVYGLVRCCDCEVKNDLLFTILSRDEEYTVVKEKISFEELEEMAYPLRDLLRKNGEFNKSIVITVDEVSVVDM